MFCILMLIYIFSIWPASVVWGTLQDYNKATKEDTYYIFRSIIWPIYLGKYILRIGLIINTMDFIYWRGLYLFLFFISSLSKIGMTNNCVDFFCMGYFAHLLGLFSLP